MLDFIRQPRQTITLFNYQSGGKDPETGKPLPPQIIDELQVLSEWALLGLNTRFSFGVQNKVERFKVKIRSAEYSGQTFLVLEDVIYEIVEFQTFMQNGKANNNYIWLIIRKKFFD